MVHIVKKKLKDQFYLYLQDSLYNEKLKKTYTKHRGYLGPQSKFTKEQVDYIYSCVLKINQGSFTINQLISLAKEWRKAKDENK